MGLAKRKLPSSRSNTDRGIVRAGAAPADLVAAEYRRRDQQRGKKNLFMMDSLNRKPVGHAYVGSMGSQMLQRRETLGSTRTD